MLCNPNGSVRSSCAVRRQPQCLAAACVCEMLRCSGNEPCPCMPTCDTSAATSVAVHRGEGLIFHIHIALHRRLVRRSVCWQCCSEHGPEHCTQPPQCTVAPPVEPAGAAVNSVPHQFACTCTREGDGSPILADNAAAMPVGLLPVGDMARVVCLHVGLRLEQQEPHRDVGCAGPAQAELRVAPGVELLLELLDLSQELVDSVVAVLNGLTCSRHTHHQHTVNRQPTRT
jgi:hypothetical protein